MFINSSTIQGLVSCKGKKKNTSVLHLFVSYVPIQFQVEGNRLQQECKPQVGYDSATVNATSCTLT